MLKWIKAHRGVSHKVWMDTGRSVSDGRAETHGCCRKEHLIWEVKYDCGESFPPGQIYNELRCSYYSPLFPISSNQFSDVVSDVSESIIDGTRTTHWASSVLRKCVTHVRQFRRPLCNKKKCVCLPFCFTQFFVLDKIIALLCICLLYFQFVVITELKNN